MLNPPQPNYWFCARKLQSKEGSETREESPQESHDKCSAFTSKNRPMIAAVLLVVSFISERDYWIPARREGETIEQIDSGDDAENFV